MKVSCRFTGLISRILWLLIPFVLLFSPSNIFAVKPRQLFIEKCAACHHKDGEARPVHATKFAAIQWERFFKQNRHRFRKEISTIISAEELEAITEYLMNHAADSDKPDVYGMYE